MRGSCWGISGTNRNWGISVSEDGSYDITGKPPEREIARMKREIKFAKSTWNPDRKLTGKTGSTG